MKEIPSARVFVSGSTGSGKSHFLRVRLLPKAQRIVCVDFVGEWERRRRELPGRLVVAQSIDETRSALRRVAGDRSWTVVSQIGPEEFPKLAALLVPVSFTDRTPVYVRAVGGCALVCDELDLLAPHSAPPVVHGLWRRGRHVGLSIFAATQSPASVSPIVRGMSRYLVLCQMHEPRSVKYFADVVPPELLARLQSMPARHALVFDAETRSAVQLSGDAFNSVEWSLTPSIPKTPAI